MGLSVQTCGRLSVFRMADKKACVVVLLVAGAAIFAEANIHLRKVEKQILDNILSSQHYDPRIRPAGINGTHDAPLDVNITLYVLDIHNVDEDKMLYSLDIYFRQEWVDERLKYSQTAGIDYITMDDEEAIWRPDLFFNDYKGYSHDVTVPNMFIRIKPDGSILYSKRYTMVLYCNMDFANFPFDEQTCHLTLLSYRWTAKQMTHKWKEPVDKAVQVSKSAHTDLFTLKKFWPESGHSWVNSTDYLYLKVKFLLVRELHYYLVQVFIPCAMCVITGYLTFWIDIKNFTARMVLAVTTLFALCISISNINLEMPRVSYTKAIDIYTGLCVTFVFAALIETVFVHFVENKHGDGRTNNINGDIDTEGTKLKKIKRWMIQNSSSKIDAGARIVYPVVFVVFQLIYWGTCLAL